MTLSIQPDEVFASAASPTALPREEMRKAIQAGLARVDLRGKRVLAIIPDGTRTAPIPLIYEFLTEFVGPAAAELDFLVALGTHQPMDEAALTKLVGVPVRDGKAGRSKILNHLWELPETFATLGTIPAHEVNEISGGRLSLDVPVKVNRAAMEYDFLLVCGPVFPHEVAGFSGGNKYFFPGISGREVIDATHWIGALVTSMAIIGTSDTPVRKMIDRAAALIPTPRLGISMVMHGTNLRGVYVGGVHGAWRAAAKQSEALDIVFVDKPFRRVLSIVPEMYDDLWTGAKGMYKMEPAIADGGEVVIYAPHISEISYTHGKVLDEVGYHIRDYFLGQWETFKDYPWGVLAHSTHLRGGGTYINGCERPRIQVTLATKIPPQRCKKVGLGYLDPDTIRLAEWENRESEGIKVIHRAGEMLYRLKK